MMPCSTTKNTRGSSQTTPPRVLEDVIRPKLSNPSGFVSSHVQFDESYSGESGGGVSRNKIGHFGDDCWNVQ
eukprot:2307559-Amphidinium_carterae.1